MTTGEGPPETLDTASIVETRIIVEKRKPIYYVLPIWRDFTETVQHYPLIQKAQ